MFKIFYRICDKANTFGRVTGPQAWDHINRKTCVMNFLNSAGIDGVHFICDNCTPETIEFIRGCGILDENISITNLGNKGTFRLSLEMAISKLIEDDIVYFVEDDYLHLKDCRKYIEEGLSKFDYVTLYDHGDKYTQPSYNPFVLDGSELTRVYITESTHWKLTNATTCTFAVRVSTLKNDFSEIMQFNKPEHPHPKDFDMFTYLINKKKRRLASPIPGRSGHIGLEMPPFINWWNIDENGIIEE